MNEDRGLRRIALGTVQMGRAYGIANTAGQVEERHAARMLDYARDVGIDVLDTAVSYGSAEERLGQLGVADFRIITKVPAVPGDVVDAGQWIRDQVEASMVRLRVNRLHGVLLHRPEDLRRPDAEAIVAAMQALKSAGRVERIGVSIYAPAELEAILPRMAVDIVQAPLNVVDRRLARSGWCAELGRRGVEVHVRSIFLQGLLLIPSQSLPAQFHPWRGLMQQWHEWLAAEQLTAVSACVAHASAYDGVDRIVVGCESVSQLKQIAAAASLPPRLAPSILESIDERLINPGRWERT
jgi:aryl-alcohol dehydrogenase-like predicted oxidoreductase